LQQVDDVDPVHLAEDEAAHVRVPAARLMAEVDSGLEQLFEFCLWHSISPWVLAKLPLRSPGPGGGPGRIRFAGERGWIERSIVERCARRRGPPPAPR